MKARFFLIVYTVANLGLIFYGLLALLKPGILLEPFLVNVFQFPPEANNAIIYLSGLYRLLGYFNLILGVLGLIILQRYWLTRTKWYLKVVIAATILSYLGPIVFDNTLGTIGFFEILEHVIFVMLLFSAFLILKDKGRLAPEGTFPASTKRQPSNIEPGNPGAFYQPNSLNIEREKEPL